MYEDFSVEMMRGDSRSLTIQAKQPNSNNPQDITGWSLWCTGKTNLRQADADAMFQKTLAAGGITITNGPLGVAKVKLDPADTAGASAPSTQIYCDVQGRDVLGDVVTLASGTILIHADVTRA